MKNTKPIIPKKVAFVAMPFGRRPSNMEKEGVPNTIDFNAIWDRSIAPALEELGYLAIRADEQTGSVIIKDMIELLVYADLVIADISVSNANVYYEAGIRHVAKEKGCVLIGAEWAQPVFDLGQIRQIRYPYAHEIVDDNNFEEIKNSIIKGIQDYSNTRSPVYELTAYPEILSLEQSSSMQNSASAIAEFQKEIRLARLKSGDSRVAAIQDLLREFKDVPQSVEIAATELLTLVRDSLGWQEVIEFVTSLDDDQQEMPFIQEQVALANAKLGEPEESIAILEDLIDRHGGTSERYGLIGGRYKELLNKSDITDHNYYLDQAIKHYQKGMNLDLNEYYCACNLPRLLKIRKSSGDIDKAIFISRLVVEICSLRIEHRKTDGWEKPTLLGAAFDSEDVKKAKEISSQITSKTQEKWYLTSTLKDLDRSVELVFSSEIKNELESIIKDLKELV